MDNKQTNINNAKAILLNDIDNIIIAIDNMNANQNLEDFDITLDSPILSGQKIAREDNIIKDTILNIENKEKILLNKYIYIKNLINNFKGNIDSVFVNQLDSIKIYILYKIQSKKEQYSLLMKLID